MDVSSTGAASTATGNKVSKTATAAGALTGDFDTFLRLLTAQMQNQDPLAPTDNTEFVSQLASFSAVEQQVQSNSTLEAISLALSGANSTGNLASWIGREVLSEGSALYSGSPVQMEFTPASGADRADLVVRDPSGQIVARIPVTATNPDVTWSGLNAKGEEVPFGNYAFTIESFSDDAVLNKQSALIFAEVTEVRMGSAGPELVLIGGGRVAADEVKAVK